MYNKWKKLFIIAMIILVACVTFCTYITYQFDITKQQLVNTENLLDDSMVELDDARKQLYDTENLLHTTRTQLEVTKNNLSVTATQLDAMKNELNIVNKQFKTLKNENSQTLSQYASLREQINIRLGTTAEYKQSFIDASNSLVYAKVQDITKGYSEDINEYWRDCESLYFWIVNNISYSHDSYIPVLPTTTSGNWVWHGEYWRTPEETINDGTGDYEDMAVLLASMLLIYNENKYSVWLLEISSNIPEESGHLAIASPVSGDRLTILDSAGSYYTGYPNGPLQSEIDSISISKWLSHWAREMPNAQIVEVFSENIYKQFSGTDEFLVWLRE